MLNFLKSLQIICRAMLIGQVLFAAVAIYLKSKGTMPDLAKEYDKIMQVAVLLLSVGFVWTGYKIFNNKMATLKAGNYTFDEKISQYRVVSISQWALSEAACILTLVSFLLTGNYAFIGLAAVLLFVFMGYYPVRARAALQMGLSSEEADKL